MEIPDDFLNGYNSNLRINLWGINEYQNKLMTKSNSTSHGYIPLSIDVFYRSLNICKSNINNPRPSFVDFGCGPGILVQIAKEMGFNAIGYEINGYLIDLLGYHRDIINGDLSNQNLFKKEYDVVYFFQPFTDTTKEVEFEINAFKSTKVGGYMIIPASLLEKLAWSNNMKDEQFNRLHEINSCLEKIEYSVFRKTKNI